MLLMLLLLLLMACVITIIIIIIIAALFDIMSCGLLVPYGCSFTNQRTVFCAATVVNVLLSSDVGRIGKYAFKNSVHYIIA